MTLIEWRDEFATGISGVDYEHQQLIEMINSVYSMLNNHSTKEDIVSCLGDVYGKISGHFILEEQLMKKYDYDQYTAHSTDHKQLLDDIGMITDEVENSANLDTVLLQQKLNDWFQIHFKTHDARLHKLQELIESGNHDKNAIRNLLSKFNM
ncbi:MAG: hemerythrin family protein [Gammaproteobacteria bacterium]|nr:hemerythrin family protein [Gammaproteobacteria bacterium]